MKRLHRVTNPRVIDGKVQRKNRTDLSPNCFRTSPPFPVVERWRPGYGYRYLLRLADVTAFLPLLPDWSYSAGPPTGSLTGENGGQRYVDADRVVEAAQEIGVEPVPPLFDM